MLERARTRTDRFLQIGEVLIKHGLGSLLGGVLSAPWAAPLRKVRQLDPQHRHTQAEHLRLALEELGPTFVKLGQLASTRQDLLPEDYTRELARLQDSSPPVPFQRLIGQFDGSRRSSCWPPSRASIRSRWPPAPSARSTPPCWTGATSS
ncbi:hypothetical protein A5N15_08520 [Rothia kristinae]|uniref:ABC1 atypical kinase-like domain-containing protein n=1 Tax=Rothia kristinae TaxID=37923 RepID=A0A657ITY9_9MICC|nr:hypothetical protein A5N15_08520 [Rothia kristinae]